MDYVAIITDPQLITEAVKRLGKPGFCQYSKLLAVAVTSDKPPFYAKNESGWVDITDLVSVQNVRQKA